MPVSMSRVGLATASRSRLSSASTRRETVFGRAGRFVLGWEPKIRDRMRRMGKLLRKEVIAWKAVSETAEGDVPAALSARDFVGFGWPGRLRRGRAAGWLG